MNDIIKTAKEEFEKWFMYYHGADKHKCGALEEGYLTGYQKAWEVIESFKGWSLDDHMREHFNASADSVFQAFEDIEARNKKLQAENQELKQRLSKYE